MLSRREKRVYGEVLKDFRPTIRTLLLQILEQKLFNLRRTKQSVYNKGSVFVPETDRLKNLPLTYIAVVNDGTVVETIRVNAEAAEHLLSKKTVLVKFDPKTTIVQKGMQYSGKKFGGGVSGKKN